MQDYKTCTGGTPSVWKVLGRVYKREIFISGLVRLIYDLASLVGPLVLSGVVVYATNYRQTLKVREFIIV